MAHRRTRAFHHYSVGGDLTVEDEVVLDAGVEQVSCRWCGAGGNAIETLEDGDTRGSAGDADAARDPAAVGHTEPGE